MARKMSQALRIDLEMLWAELVIDHDMGTDRGRIALGNILGYRCDDDGYKIAAVHDSEDPK